jgi:hypothetical protein
MVWASSWAGEREVEGSFILGGGGGGVEVGG